MLYSLPKYFVCLSTIALLNTSLNAVPDWNVLSGDWNVASNWNPTNVPLVTDDPTIANDGEATLDASGVGKNLFVGSQNTSFLILKSGADLQVGFLSSIGRALNDELGGSVTMESGSSWSSSSLELGNGGGSNGEVILQSITDLVNLTITGTSTLGLTGGQGQASASGLLATWNSNALVVGDGVSSEGNILLQDGAKLTISNQSVIGVNEGTGTVALQGDGTIWTTNTITVGSDLGTGNLAIDSGARLDALTQSVVGNNGGVGAVDISGDNTSWTTDSLFIGVKPDAIGTVTIGSGALAKVTTQVVMASNLAATATLNLNGNPDSRGVLLTNELTGSIGTRAVNFDGGILKANAINNSFITGFSPGPGLQILAGGAYIDSNGHNVGTNDEFNGLGVLNKEGSGRLTLAGNLNNTGGVVVNEGRVVTTPTATVTGPVTVNQAATMRADGPLNGSVMLNDAASMTINNTVAGPVVVNFNSELIDNGPLNSTLTMNGDVDVTVNSTVAGPTVLNGGILTLNGTLLNSATVNTGEIFVAATGVINGPSVVNNNGTMAIFGILNNNLTMNDVGQVGVFAGGKIKGNAAVNDNAELLVNGLVTGLVTTQKNGILLGSGIIGALDNGGTVSPGENSIATLTILKNYINRATGRYQVDLNSAGQSDLLSVGGTATLQGGTLELDATPGNYLSGTSYTLITAVGGLSGNFETVISDLPIHYILKYFPNSLVLQLGDALNFHGLKGNARQVANYINTFGTFSGDFLTVLEALQSLNSDELFNALDQLHPAPFQAVTITSGDAAHLINDSFMDRLNFLRMTQCGPCYPCNSCNQGGAWISGLVDHVRFDKIQGLRGFNATNGGIALGYDQCFFNRLITGIGAGYSNNYIKWNKHYGQSDGNTYYLGIYATHFDENYYADASLLGFTGHYKSKRHIQFADINRHAKSKQCNWGLNPHFGAGWIIDYCGLDVIPYGEMDYYYVSQDKFHEHGADSLNLHVKSKDGNELRLETGVRFAKTYDCCGYGQFLPYASISYVGHRYYGRKFNSSFNNQPKDFAVFGTDRCFNQAEFGLGFAYLINEQFAINTSYEIDVGSNRQEQEFNLELNYRF